MLKSIKASIKDTFTFGFGNIAVKIVGFVLIPLYTNPVYFSVDDFGIIGILDISALLLMSIFSSFLPQSLTRWYWAKDHLNNQKGIFFMALITQVLLSLIFCLLLIPFSGNLSSIIFKQTDWSVTITLIIVASGLQGINTIITTLLKLQAKSLLFALTSLSKLLVVLLLTIYFITSRKMGIQGIYLAQVIGNMLFILLLLPYTFKNCRLHFNLSTWLSMISYGLPLALAGLAAVLFNVIDRYALNSLSLLTFVATYTLAYKLSSTIKLVLVDTIKLAIFPRMIRRLDNPDNLRFYSKAMLYTSYVVMFGIIGVSLFSYEIIVLIAKSADLWDAYLLVPILSISVFFLNMREVSVYGLIVTKKTNKISTIVIISTAVNILLNLFLIPLWNAMGAALAIFISQVFYWLIMHYIAQKSYHIPYENKKLLMIFILGTLLSSLGFIINDMALFLRLVIKIITLGSFPLLLYLLNFYEYAELKAIKGFFNKWSSLRKLGDNLKSLKDINDDF